MAIPALALLKGLPTYLFRPSIPTTTDNTCIGTKCLGLLCMVDLDLNSSLRAAEFEARLRVTDLFTVDLEHITQGEDVNVQDCFCSIHKGQATAVAKAWLKQMRVVRDNRRQKQAQWRMERLEMWLEDVNPENGQGPVEDAVKEV